MVTVHLNSCNSTLTVIDRFIDYLVRLSTLRRKKHASAIKNSSHLTAFVPGTTFASLQSKRDRKIFIDCLLRTIEKSKKHKNSIQVNRPVQLE